MSKIAFFDFDGTITTKDTLLEVIKFQKGKTRFYTGFLLNAPVLIALKLKLVSNQAAKERILQYFFKSANAETFQQACDRFVERALPPMIRKGAQEEIGRLKAKGFKVIIVSASPGNWIKKWSDANGTKLIATNLEVVDGIITGKIAGINNHGHEKVVRIRAEYDLSKYNEIYCYGDTRGDKPMLALATKQFYKPFRD